MSLPFTMRKQPVAWTVAGSDSGGGAGIQADLRTFSFLGVYGCSVIAALTAQNPGKVKRVEAVSPEMVKAQLQALAEAMMPDALKTGMLFSRHAIREVCDFLQENKVPAVTDPVMISSSGTPLLEKESISLLQERLFPLVTLLTPNIPEAEYLTGEKIRTLEDRIRCGKKCVARYGCSILLKGGHMIGDGEGVTDILFDAEGKKAIFYSASPISFPPNASHGTGCTLSSAVAAFLARKEPLSEAVRKGKAFVTGSLAECVQLKGDLAAMWPPETPLPEYETKILSREVAL